MTSSGMGRRTARREVAWCGSRGRAEPLQYQCTLSTYCTCDMCHDCRPGLITGIIIAWPDSGPMADGCDCRA